MRRFSLPRLFRKKRNTFLLVPPSSSLSSFQPQQASKTESEDPIFEKPQTILTNAPAPHFSFPKPKFETRFVCERLEDGHGSELQQETHGERGRRGQ